VNILRGWFISKRRCRTAWNNPAQLMSRHALIFTHRAANQCGKWHSFLSGELRKWPPYMTAVVIATHLGALP